MATQRVGSQISQRPQKRLTTTLGSLFVFDTCKASDLKMAMDAMEAEAQGGGAATFDFDSPFAASSTESPSPQEASYSGMLGLAEEADMPFATFGTESIFNVFESQSYRPSDDVSESSGGGSSGEEGRESSGMSSGTLDSRRPSSGPSSSSSTPYDTDEFGYADEELDDMIQQLDAAMEEGKSFYPLRTIDGSDSLTSPKPSAFAILASQLADDDTGGNDWLNEEAFFNDFQFAPEWLPLTFSMKSNASGASTSVVAASVGEKGRTTSEGSLTMPSHSPSTPSHSPSNSSQTLPIHQDTPDHLFSRSSSGGQMPSNPAAMLSNPSTTSSPSRRQPNGGRKSHVRH